MCAICKYKCPHVGCSKVFFNSHGLKCHKDKCKFKHWYIADHILVTRWVKGKREFKVIWCDYPPENDMWEPRDNLASSTINKFLKANDLYDYNITTR